MIRFSCGSCQKVLTAPDQKAGVKLACPNCKNPLVVPPAPASSSQAVQAAPSAPPSTAPALASNAAGSADIPKKPFVRRFFGEMVTMFFAALRQTLKPFTLVFEIARRNRLRRKASDTQFALGQRLYETQKGDKKLRARIQSLGERIQSIQDVRGDSKAVVAERKGLMMQLSEGAMNVATVPDDISGEHERARTARDKFQSQEKSVSGALGGLLPPDRLAWRRVVVGYMLVGIVAFFGWEVYMMATRSSREARALEAEQMAAKQKRDGDDATWLTEKNAEQIVEKCGPSVALIRFKVGKREGGGTGFMIRPGILATNAHVVDSVLAEDLRVYFPSVKELAKTPHPARVLFFDRKRDLALLAVEPKVPPLRLADNFEFKSGKNITIIGCPGVGEMQLENAVNTGVLSTKTEVEKMPYFQLGASVNPGNSGGPVFDNRGQVIGIVTLKASQENIAFCIPWQDFKDRLDAIEKEDPQRTAATSQSMQTLHVVVERVFISAFIYTKMMSGYASAMREATSRGRPAEEGVTKARQAMDGLLRRVSPYLIDGKYQALGTKLLTDPNLPEDVRRKFSDLWKTYEELKRNVDSPSGTPNAYASKAQQMDNQFKTNVTALSESLGFEARKVEEDD